MLKRWRLRRALRRVSRAIDQFDAAMCVSGIKRAERRQLWREVIAGRADVSALIGLEKR
jgi:hypothetical protein